jgi:predicted nuclease of predicted toxin-antitoxin system
MTLLIDENLPRALVDWFSKHGISSVHIYETGFAGRPDPELAVYAVETRSTILTKDKDFEDLASRVGGLRVIRLTIGNVRTSDLVTWLESKLPQLRAALASEVALCAL